LGVQLGHTLLDRNTFPFCSYNVFAFQAPARLVAPLEFFRARQVVMRAVVGNDDPVRGESVATQLLRRLNEAPWPAFDETLASARPAPGTRFVGLEVVLFVLDTRDYRPPGPPRILGRRPVYSFLAEP
jgi:hypothetical protein